MKDLFLSNWESIWKVAFCTVIAYVVLLIFIRISGKRTLAKLNAFDFVVTVSLGSTLSSMILMKVKLIEGSIALIIIISLQYLLAYTARKSKKMEELINSKPTLLYYDGIFLEDAMTRELITKEEIYAEVRAYRLLNMEDVKAVVIELNGNLTVVKKVPINPEDHSLQGLEKIN